MLDCASRTQQMVQSLIQPYSRNKDLEADLSKLAFHLLGRGDPAGVPEPQLPIEAAPKGPDLSTGCGQHAEVPGGSHCPHHLPLNPCIQYTFHFIPYSLRCGASCASSDILA